MAQPIPERPAEYVRGHCCATCREYTYWLIASGEITRVEELSVLPRGVTREAILEAGQRRRQNYYIGLDPDGTVHPVDENIPFNCMLCQAVAGFGKPGNSKQYESVCKACEGISGAHGLEWDENYEEIPDPEEGERIRAAQERLRATRIRPEDNGDGVCVHCERAIHRCICGNYCDGCDERNRHCMCGGDPFEDEPILPEPIVIPGDQIIEPGTPGTIRYELRIDPQTGQEVPVQVDPPQTHAIGEGGRTPRPGRPRRQRPRPRQMLTFGEEPITVEPAPRMPVRLQFNEAQFAEQVERITQELNDLPRVAPVTDRVDPVHEFDLEGIDPADWDTYDNEGG